MTYTGSGVRAEPGDLFLPAGAGPFPVVLYLHGGSWRSGTKRDFKRLATDLAAKGYAGFSINYDLHPHSFPKSWNESRTALEFLRTHAAEYHLDTGRMVVAGTSAGGELAALLALVPGGPAGAGDGASLEVQAAVVLNGVFNLHGNYHVIHRYLGGTCDKLPEVCTAASPDDRVHAGAPPFFVGHGTADRVVPYREAQEFIGRLKGAGVPVTAFAAEGGPHMYWQKRKFYATDLAAIEKFLGTLPGLPSR